jgi:hypothetical protein
VWIDLPAKAEEFQQGSGTDSERQDLRLTAGISTTMEAGIEDDETEVVFLRVSIAWICL